MRRLVMVAALAGCDVREAPRGGAPANAATTPADSMGAAPVDARTVVVRGHTDLTESSAAATSARQPDIWFTLNDSGHEPVLFALDTTGAARGRWFVRGARNIDWESAADGPCGGAAPRDAGARCIYIGDTGDNEATAASRSIYRLSEPTPRDAGDAGPRGTVSAARLTYRYADGPHDVEAMYVAPDASVYLITKRPLAALGGRPLRPALIFRLVPQAWSARGVQEAALADSLPIVPGSAFARFVTDASLSPDAKYLAVRTYMQVYVFATDSATGRVRTTVPPAVCNIASLQENQGEGITWLGTTRRLLLTSEGRGASIRIVTCPLPE